MQCRTCGERGKDGLSLLEPEHASMLQFIIIHLQKELAGRSFFVCHDCVVEIKHWKHFLTRFQTSQTHFQQVLATSKQHLDSPQQTADVEPSLESILPKCRVLVTKLLECDSCSFYSDNKPQLAAHVQTHLKPPNTSDATGFRNLAVKEGRISRNHKCDQCGTKSAHPEMLLWHTANCHGADAIVRVKNIGRHQHFQCTLCENEFRDQYLIIKHLFSEHNVSNLPFQCNFCGRQFLYNSVTKKHQLKCKNRHNINRALSMDHKCEQCSVKYAHAEVLAWHTANCHGADAIVRVVKIGRQHYYYCTFCENEFRDQYLIIKHLVNEHNISNLPFHCNFCGRQFLNICDTKRHHLKCKNGNSLSRPISLDYRCTQCGLRYAHPEILAWHTSNCHGSDAIVKVTKINRQYKFLCNFCKTVCTSHDSVLKHLHSKHRLSNLPFLCNFCDKRFVHISALRIHELKCKNTLNISGQIKHKVTSVHPENINASIGVKCKLCYKVFKSKMEMKNHISNIHGKKFCLKCEHCHEEFYSILPLFRHCRNQHPGKHVLKCDICNVEFSSYKKYIYHKHNKHLGRVFTCKVCCATFSCPDSLNKHIKTKHSEDQLLCKFCNAKFKCKEYLHRHVRDVHTGLILHCNQCDYITCRKYDLIIHIRRNHLFN